MEEVKLMKGNEAVAEAAIRAGVDAYFGYPITPQSEVIEYLMAEEPHKRTGMVDRKSTRLNSSHTDISRMPSSA